MRGVLSLPQALCASWRSWDEERFVGNHTPRLAHKPRLSWSIVACNHLITPHYCTNIPDMKSEKVGGCFMYLHHPAGWFEQLGYWVAAHHGKFLPGPPYSPNLRAWNMTLATRYIVLKLWFQTASLLSFPCSSQKKWPWKWPLLSNTERLSPSFHSTAKTMASWATVFYEQAADRCPLKWRFRCQVMRPVTRLLAYYTVCSYNLYSLCSSQEFSTCILPFWYAYLVLFLASEVMAF